MGRVRVVVGSLVAVAAAAAVAGSVSADSRHNETPSRSSYATVSAGYRLVSGQTLDETHFLRSPNGRHTVLTDGSSGEDLRLLLTSASCTPIALVEVPAPADGLADVVLAMQTDGNLVAYSDGAAVWSSGTAGNPGATFSVQDDRNLVVYSATNVPLWASYSACADMTSFRSPSGAGVTTSSSSAVLTSGQSLTSPSGAYRLIMQSDGNLVLVNASSAPLWWTSTASPGASAVLQEDGNFVVYAAGGGALWSSGSAKAGAVHTQVRVTNGGQVEVVQSTTAVTGAIVLSVP